LRLQRSRGSVSIPSPKVAEAQVRELKRKLDECLELQKWVYHSAYDRKVSDAPKVRTSKEFVSSTESAATGAEFQRRRKRAGDAWDRLLRVGGTLDGVKLSLEKSMPDHRPAETELEPVPDVEGLWIAERRAVHRRFLAQGEGYGAS
jgi:hypothetical protein